MTRILITGAGGLVGRALLQELIRHQVIATDLTAPDLPANARFRRMDVTGDDPAQVIAQEQPEVVIHLASVVTPPKGSTRRMEYAVDVTGTRNVLAACVAQGVRRLVVTSSGAAYGYHPRNATPLTEDMPLQGNPEFSYSRHKHLVEQMLAETRAAHPDLQQVVLRVGTVLGPGVENQITALFRRKRLLRVAGTDGAFVFIWAGDLARILHRAATDGPPGIYNVAGDGALPIADLATILRKPVLTLPAWVLRLALGVARPLGLTRYGPEQVRFLQYRPVLDNTRLKTVFGYTPHRTTRQAFTDWAQGAGL
ncbi:SDR family oxidoreductase [Thalassovita sp.]|uniref:SDR family oxidoreductase n=1 Tax=Thalassovita sp. TaxID=1979401 RepID=UPI0029DE5F1E|nr:SDR family oxidoreductase [Thalassovita sp.]